MSKLIAAIKNENMKINQRLGTKLMYSSSVIIVFVIGILQSFFSEPPGNTWEFLYNNIELYVSITVVYAVIIAAGNIPNEVSNGTIKLLLIRPINRSKILLSKYIATVLFSIFLLLIVVTSSLIVGSIFFGFQGPSQATLVGMDGNIIENILSHIIASIGFVFIDMLMMITIAFMISTIFYNNAMAIGIVIFLRFVGPNIVIALQQYDWAKYILFANLNLRQHLSGTPGYIENLTLSFSIGILVVYFIIFNILTWWIFNKKDITA